MVRKLPDRRSEDQPAFFPASAVPEHACHVEHRQCIIGIEDKRLTIGSDRFVGSAQMIERGRNLKPAHRIGLNTVRLRLDQRQCLSMPAEEVERGPEAIAIVTAVELICLAEAALGFLPIIQILCPMAEAVPG